MSAAVEVLVANLRGKLDGQLASLESARSRAAIALSVSGVVAGLFGPKLLAQPGSLDLVAVVLFGVTSLFSIYTLVPHNLKLWPVGKGWTTWVEQHGQEAGAETVLALQMVEDMADWYDFNKPVLNRVQWCIGATFVGVALQVIAWSIAIFNN